MTYDHLQFLAWMWNCSSVLQMINICHPELIIKRFNFDVVVVHSRYIWTGVMECTVMRNANSEAHFKAAPKTHLWNCLLVLIYLLSTFLILLVFVSVVLIYFLRHCSLIIFNIIFIFLLQIIEHIINFIQMIPLSMPMSMFLSGYRHCTKAQWQ